MRVLGIASCRGRACLALGFSVQIAVFLAWLNGSMRGSGMASDR